MTTINFTNGSEKQNAWANSIATKWLATIDSAIWARTVCPENEAIIAALTTERDAFLAGIAKMSAKACIDAREANIGAMLVTKAGKTVFG